MLNRHTIEYWQDGEWLVGRLKGIPGVFSQGKSLDELIENIRDAYRMMVESNEPIPMDVVPKYVEIEIAV